MDIYTICKWIVLKQFELFSLVTSIVIITTQLNGFNYCYPTSIILFNKIIYEVVSNIPI